MKVVSVYTKKERNFFASSKVFSIFIILVAGFLLISYIYQANLFVRSSLMIEKYQQRITQLREENKNLEIVFSKKNSLSDYKDLIDEKEFEKITKVEYISVISESVAVK